MFTRHRNALANSNTIEQLKTNFTTLYMCIGIRSLKMYKCGVCLDASSKHIKIDYISS